MIMLNFNMIASLMIMLNFNMIAAGGRVGRSGGGSVGRAGGLKKKLRAWKSSTHSILNFYK